MSTETLEGLDIFVHVTVGLVIPEHHPPVDGPGRDGDLLALVVGRAEAREGAAVPQSQHVCVIPVLPIRRPVVEVSARIRECNTGGLVRDLMVPLVMLRLQPAEQVLLS